MLSKHPRVRLGLYLASVTAAVVAPFVAVGAPEYGAATAAAAGVLAAAAGVTALTNIDSSEGRHEA